MPTNIAPFPISPFAQGTYNGAVPKEGPKVVPLALDFTAAGGYTVDLSNLFSGGQLTVVQTVYADNSANPAPLQFFVPDTQETITFPPFSQGFLPLFFSSTFKLVVTSSGGVKLVAQLLNYNVAPSMWNSNGFPAIGVGGVQQVSDVILDAAVSDNALNVRLSGNISLTDRSALIGAANTPQVVMGNNPSRAFFSLMNTSVDTMWFSYGAIVPAVNGIGSYLLAPGAYYETATGLAPTEAINIMCANSGAGIQYAASEG